MFKRLSSIVTSLVSNGDYFDKMNTFQNRKHKSHVDTILNNKVDSDVQSMLFPLNLMQYIIFCPKYRIKHSTIIPNGSITNIISIIAALVLSVTFVYATYKEYYKDDYNNQKTAYLQNISFYDFFHYSFGFTLNFLNGAIQTKTHIRFVLSFQKVHRFLNNETSFNHFIVWNWIIVIGAFGAHFIVISCFCKLTGLPYLSLYICYISITFHTNIIYSIRILKLLENKVGLWSSYVLNSQDLYDSQRKTCTKEMFEGHKDLLECYDIYKDCFHQLVSAYLTYLGCQY